MSKEEISKHLEFIQGAINRMAANSFLLKGWTITIVAALFALAAKDSNSSFVWLALFPALSFWGLDAYYLWQERLFRKLYDKIRLASESEERKIDPFTLDTRQFRWGIYEWLVKGWLRALIAPTIISLYGTVLLSIIVVSCLLNK